jgi:hypothetical protein
MMLFAPLHGFRPGNFFSQMPVFFPLAVSAGNDYTESR